MEINNENILKKIRLLNALSDDIQEIKDVDKDAGYQKVRKKIKRSSHRRSVIFFINRVAAILAIPLLISTSILSYFLMEEKKTEVIPLPAVTYTEVTALPGTIIKTQLPDNSVVWLNSGSTLSYPTQFTAGKRNVNLTGEAFFEVQSYENHPFEVNTDNGVRILAKGTSFNVNAYPEDQETETVLQEGVVDVFYNGKTLTMSPNEIAIINKTSDTWKRSRINIDEKIGWKDGLLIFRNTPLDEVFKRISRRYNVEIILHKESDVNYNIRATFSNETLPQVLDILKVATPIRWSEKNMHQKPDLTYSRQQIDVWIK